uniref:Uncharacterized protein n=1 Tax=Anguilla anguilla TaxID=7936 RepID=A0A0E9V5V8_ANGAN
MFMFALSLSGFRTVSLATLVLI